ADDALIFDTDYDTKWSRALAGLGVDAARLSSQSGRAESSFGHLRRRCRIRAAVTGGVRLNAAETSARLAPTAPTTTRSCVNTRATPTPSTAGAAAVMIIRSLITGSFFTPSAP